VSENQSVNRKLVRKIIRLCRKKKIRVYRHYAGRYMFRKECIGFCGSDYECIELAVLIRKKTGYNYCRDNLGLDKIYYFPGISDPSTLTTNLKPKGDPK
jgi:hypothetical protein